MNHITERSASEFVKRKVKVTCEHCNAIVQDIHATLIKFIADSTTRATMKDECKRMQFEGNTDMKYRETCKPHKPQQEIR